MVARTVPPYRRTHRRSRALLLAAILGTVTCDTVTGPAPCNAFAVGVVTASAGTSPRISWVADCQAVKFAVFSPTTSAAIWQLRADRKGIPKPVDYGVVPAGVREEHPAEALQVGTSYGVFITILSSRGDTLSVIAVFTP